MDDIPTHFTGCGGNSPFDKIKTHFPPAKIKKIMQTDEDIGKVSQATPVITGRSLEFFIAMLVDKSSQMAKEQGSKRISGDIMKKTIMADEKFDFLREIVCPEAVKHEDSTHDDAEADVEGAQYAAEL
ncbi:AGR156Cp [Eremothecium gossypii ATCC 10895]|uniref:AGR156Cp n=1 Tax=Eremothecium gossypii (strain ATCC 10895 / CBS 109.51 / FGSC 9923 / NRRL Y-1056) TaxID=284811 RepID=Q74ZP2_EREGS|nr:AGR156Cp [Eremothecium gossypii ATCC 10895]AAS54646.1 AGR156Cp [Eremothecium gossypii ATCC 10895]AEY98976.1 FAGR156Cp [Eremothecium gossypii FDAG1]